jgi:penicillin-binding protein 1C
MNDSDANPSRPAGDDPSEKTEPGRRMKRLLAGSTENESALNAQPVPSTGQQDDPGDLPQAEEPLPAAEQPPAETPPTLSTPPADLSAPAEPAPAQPPSETPPPPAADQEGQTRDLNQLPPTDPALRPYNPPPPDWNQAEQPTIPGAPPPYTIDSSSAETRAMPASRSGRTPPPPPGYNPIPGRQPGENLPRRVEERDPNATQVTPAAYQHRAATRPVSSYPQQTGHTQARRAAAPTRANPAYPPPYQRSAGIPPYGSPPLSHTGPRRVSGWKRSLGCALRSVIILLFLVVFAFVAAGSWLVFQYFTIAQGLPSVDQLRANASQFETTRIFDRSGGVLYEILDPNAGRRTFVPLDKISPNLIAATVATEDREYYNHPGFDPIAIARAFYQNYTSGEVVSGASTITQQLARTLLLSTEERFTRSYERKAREIVLAAEIERKYSKDDILELYLNENNYGNLAYGVEAAAETYFNTTASNLTPGQAAFLAGLPQSPAIYDVYTNRDASLNRQKQVVLLMLEASQTKNCIFVSTRPDPVCFNEMAAVQAVREMEAYPFERPQMNMRYPHWVTYIRALLEEKYDPQTIYRSGFNVYTTLDPALQDQAQAMIRQQVANLADRNAYNGALVAIRPSTGEILAMVGSPNFNDDEHSGQVNMAVSPRQPGSSIKPLTYALAFEKGWTPATLIWDVPSDFPPSGDPNDPREPYRPVNYDGRFHGPVTVRSALANSYNIPAVKALQFTGIYGDSGLINYAKRLGIDSFERDDYGLSLTLGGGDVSLLNMTSAFSVYANSGKRMEPVAITRITNFRGEVIFEYRPPNPRQVVRPEHAFLISSILSDNEARTPMFGSGSVLNLPFQAAAKTGTTNDYRDNWTVGYTPDLAVGVWIGNANYTPMNNVTGLSGAAPAWSAFMQFAVPHLTGGNPTRFPRPAGVEEKVICALSGAEPSDYCPQQRAEFFASGQPPRPKDDDLWKKVRVDTWTGLRASAECSDFTDEKFTLNVEDPWAINWVKDTQEGRDWAASAGFDWPITFLPKRECKISDPRPQIIFASLTENQTVVNSPLDIYAVVSATDRFQRYRLEWGLGDDPVEWRPLVENITSQYNNPERIHSWDLAEVPAGRVTLRIFLNSTDPDLHAERRIRINLNVPTPTPTLTPTPTPTLVPTETPTPTLTPVPTETPTPTPTVGS